MSEESNSIYEGISVKETQKYLKRDEKNKKIQLSTKGRLKDKNHQKHVQQTKYVNLCSHKLQILPIQLQNKGHNQEGVPNQHSDSRNKQQLPHGDKNDQTQNNLFAKAFIAQKKVDINLVEQNNQKGISPQSQGSQMAQNIDLNIYLSESQVNTMFESYRQRLDKLQRDYRKFQRIFYDAPQQQDHSHLPTSKRARKRRKDNEVTKKFYCPIQNCKNGYTIIASLKQHIARKHFICKGSIKIDRYGNSTFNLIEKQAHKDHCKCSQYNAALNERKKQTFKNSLQISIPSYEQKQDSSYYESSKMDEQIQQISSLKNNDSFLQEGMVYIQSSINLQNQKNKFSKLKDKNPQMGGYIKRKQAHSLFEQLNQNIKQIEENHNFVYKSYKQMVEKQESQKINRKKNKRKADQVERTVYCFMQNCGKGYSVGSALLNHLEKKHSICQSSIRIYPDGTLTLDSQKRKKIHKPNCRCDQLQSILNRIMGEQQRDEDYSDC